MEMYCIYIALWSKSLYYLSLLQTYTHSSKPAFQGTRFAIGSNVGICVLLNDYLTCGLEDLLFSHSSDATEQLKQLSKNEWWEKTAKLIQTKSMLFLRRVPLLISNSKGGGGYTYGLMDTKVKLKLKFDMIK